jgi:hypothetical protein
VYEELPCNHPRGAHTGSVTHRVQCARKAGHAPATRHSSRRSSSLRRSGRTPVRYRCGRRDTRFERLNPVALIRGHAGSRAFVNAKEAGPLHQVKVLKTPWFCVVLSRPSGLWGVSLLMLPPLWAILVGVVLYLVLR